MNLPYYIRVGSGMVRTSSIIAIDKILSDDKYCVSVLNPEVSLLSEEVKYKTINNEEAEKLMATLEYYSG